MAVDNFRFRWQNFRGFSDTGWFPIRKLNIIIGPNNSGKSSLIAPLLLLKQTWDSRDPDVPLVLHGDLLSVGSYKDLVWQHDISRRLTLSVDFVERPEDKEPPSLGDLPPTKFDLTFQERQQSKPFIELYRYVAADGFDRVLIDRRKKRRGYSLLKYPQLIDAVMESGESPFSDFLKRNPETDKFVDGDVPTNFLFDSGSVSFELRSRSHDDNEGGGTSFELRPEPERSTYLELYRQIGLFTRHMFVNHLLRDLSYVGPLRQRPRRIYEVTQEIPMRVGHGGERTAELMYHHQNDAIQAAIDSWLKKFGLADGIACDQINDTLFSLIVRTGEAHTNIADCGFGLSQILPLVVNGITLDDRTLMVAEQPEIHLNPKQQATLADLFVSLAKDKTVLVETHSEHLLLRLRRLIAEKKIDAGDVALLFVEKLDGESKVREVPLRNDGSLSSDDWPSGFFEDSLEQALGLARAQSRGDSE